MKDVEIKCPYCKEPHGEPEIYSSGAKKCIKCRKWFEYQENKVVTYETWKIKQ